MRHGEIFLSGRSLPAGSDVYVFRHGINGRYNIIGPRVMTTACSILNDLVRNGDVSEELIGVLSQPLSALCYLRVTGWHLTSLGGRIFGLAQDPLDAPDRPLIRRR